VIDILADLQKLLDKIGTQSAIIGILGLGYVGLPLAIVFAKRFKVIGFDISEERIDSLREGEPYNKGISNQKLLDRSDNLSFTHDERLLTDCDVKIICVPTPLNKQKEPDLSFVKNAGEIVAKHLKKGQFVILESTTYPGTTEEIVLPILEKSGLVAGKDFGVSYSPERIDPGNTKYTIENTPKIVGGINEDCAKIAEEIYKSVIDARIIRVKDCKTAEATKIVENVFREVNIALVNELALIFEKMQIDTWEVISAASTKPFGFMAHYPGPGVGGHCIPLDPYYLAYKARKVGQATRFIELSGEINDLMKIHTVDLIITALRKAGHDVRNAKISVFGLAYKGNIDDTRESPSQGIIEMLLEIGGDVKVYDPFAKSIETKFGSFISEKNFVDALKGADCAVFVTDHDLFKELDLRNYKELMNAPIVVDCRNIFAGRDVEEFEYYAIGKPMKLK